MTEKRDIKAGYVGATVFGLLGAALISHYACQPRQEEQVNENPAQQTQTEPKKRIRWSPKTNLQGVQVAINRDKAQLTLDDKIRSEWTKYSPIRNVVTGKGIYIDEEFDIKKHNYVELNFSELHEGETYTYTMVGRGFPKPLIEFEFTKPNQ